MKIARVPVIDLMREQIRAIMDMHWFEPENAFCFMVGEERRVDLWRDGGGKYIRVIDAALPGEHITKIGKFLGFDIYLHRDPQACFLRFGLPAAFCYRCDAPMFGAGCEMPNGSRAYCPDCAPLERPGMYAPLDGSEEN